MTYPKKQSKSTKKRGLPQEEIVTTKKGQLPLYLFLLSFIKHLQITAITDVAGRVKGEGNDPL